MRVTLSLSESQDRTAVERAVAELRMGRPVLLEGEGERALIQGVEDLDSDRAAKLDAVAGGQARLVLPAARLKRLGLDREQHGAIPLPGHGPDPASRRSPSRSTPGSMRPCATPRCSTRMRWNSPGSRSRCRPWS